MMLISLIRIKYPDTDTVLKYYILKYLILLFYELEATWIFSASVLTYNAGIRGAAWRTEEVTAVCSS